MDAFSPATRAWFESAFGAPTRVQTEGWAPILAGEHALLLAPTGSGKTLAAFLACLDRLLLDEDPEPGVRVLYVSPLKALAYDIERNLRAPLVGIRHAAARLGAKVRPIRVDVRTGDTPSADRRAQLKNPAEILVTTPESLYLLLGSGARDTLRRVQTVIVDEIHAMAGTKRGVHLALSLERLSARAERDPQRIGLSATQRPLDRIAGFLGGDRPVRIVDASEPPRIALQVVVPVEDMDEPVVEEPVADGAIDVVRRKRKPGIWPTLYPRILELIRAHRTTIVFTNSRLLCERLAQQLNELAGEELVRAHHGSIARHQREAIEEMLKAGQLPALVATSSLELGIDMGSVDLVIQVESPGSVARGLQRVGRAGHGVGQTSEGVLFPKFKGDLLECAVVSRAMAAGRIEETRLPLNCLDVLSQQVVAACAMDPWRVDDLFALVRRARPYATLTPEVFASVLDMLSGRYPSDDFADLRPRLTWDRTADVLTGRKGAEMLVRMNPGTIPDRGLFGVHLGPEGPRIGELDEEMVYESRRGDNVILGATTWRVEEITRDRVVVSPAPGEPGRLPFWHGDSPGRPLELGREIGRFTRELAEEADPVAWLQGNTPLDALAAGNVVGYLREQKAATGVLPSDRTVVVEQFKDELGDWRVCILTPFGARVHAPWALALEALLSARAGFIAQTMYSDDGIVVRLADADDPPPTELLLPDVDEVEDLVVEQLRHSALFASRFREAAGRALLLPKRRADKRSPLWQQRIRASNLLATASRFPAFPIVLETYRECLQDVFDLPALKEVLGAIRRREVRVEIVQTASASPFARSLVFAFVAAYLYEGDAPLAERRAQALTLDRELLRELLGQEELRELLDAGAVAAVEEELTGLAPERRARNEDELHDLLRRIGNLTEVEVTARADGDAPAWLASLERQRRVYRGGIAGEARFIAAEDAARYRDALGVSTPQGLPSVFLESVDDPLGSLVARYARTRGPFRAAALAERFGLLPAQVTPTLKALEAEGRLVHGEMRPGGTGREWCDAEVLRRLRRRSLAVLRKEVEPVDASVLGRFLPAWHGIGARRGRLREVIDQLEGLPLPWSAFEAEILPARIPDHRARDLDELGASGEIVWVGRGSLGPSDGRVALYRRERVPLLLDAPDPPEDLEPLHRAILDHLAQRGASFLTLLQGALGNPSIADLAAALWDLAWAGLVTNDTFLPLRTLGSRRPLGGGRWSLVSELTALAAPPTARAAARANLLLDRYGVVSREAAQAEDVPGGFSSLYPIFSAMEDGGRVRRGWFVDGLTGAQFARPGVVDRIRAHREEAATALVLSAIDPANPYGALLPWPDTADGRPVRRVAGTLVVLVDGRAVLTSHLGGRSLTTLDAPPDLLARGLRALTGHVRRSFRLDHIDGAPAPSSPHASALLKSGFAADYTSLHWVQGATA